MHAHGCVLVVEEAGKNVDLFVRFMPIGDHNGEPENIAVPFSSRSA